MGERSAGPARWLHIPGRGVAVLLGLIAAPIIFLAALRMGSTDSLPGVTFDATRGCR